MSDLVKRLRASICNDKCRAMEAALGCECAEAADRIEQLEAEAKGLRANNQMQYDANEKLVARIEQLDAALRNIAKRDGRLADQVACYDCTYSSAEATATLQETDDG